MSLYVNSGGSWQLWYRITQQLDVPAGFKVEIANLLLPVEPLHHTVPSLVTRYNIKSCLCYLLTWPRTFWTFSLTHVALLRSAFTFPAFSGQQGSYYYSVCSTVTWENVVSSCFHSTLSEGPPRSQRSSLQSCMKNIHPWWRWSLEETNQNTVSCNFLQSLHCAICLCHDDVKEKHPIFKWTLIIQETGVQSRVLNITFDIRKYI